MCSNERSPIYYFFHKNKMFKTFKKLFIVGLCLQTNLVFSQNETSLSDLVVTASKTPQKQDQTGKVLTVLSDSVLRANSNMSLGQILNQQVGIVTIGSGQTLGSPQNISVRGAGFGLTLILIDGVPVNEPSGIGNTFDINLLPINQIERVEILKGAQSTLYGSDAVAGVINIITKKGIAQKLKVSGNLDFSSFGTQKAGIQALGTINKTNYQFSINGHNSDGFSSAQEKNINEKFEVDGFRSLNISGKINQEINKNFIINALIRNSHYKTDLDESAFIDELDYITKTKNTQIGGGAEFLLKNGKLTFNHLHNKTNRYYLNDLNYVPKDSYYFFSEGNYGSKAEFSELFTNLKINKNTDILIGSDFRFQNMSYSYYSLSNFKYEDTPIVPKDATIKNGSAYSSISVKNLGNFGIEFGGRLNYHSTYKWNNTFAINPYFNVNKKLKIFTSYATSYRNPALYQLFSPYGNLDLQPEKAKTFEFGSQINHEKNNLRVVYFDRKLDNVIFFLSSFEPPYGKYINQNQQRDKGLEIDANLIISKLSISTNYTLLNAKITDIKNGKDSTYSNLLRKPKNVFNLSLSYQFSSKISGNVSYQFFSKRTDLYYNPSTYLVENVDLKQYQLINLNLSYKIKPNLAIYAGAQNLGNVKYTEIYGYKSRPLTLSGGIRINQ